MKQILLTGSSSGFGFLTFKTLAAQGHTVYATMRNINGANATSAKEIRDWATANKAKVEVVELDVTSETSVNTAVATILKQSGGKLDVLINNAGLSFLGITETLSNEQTNQLFQVNVIGADRVIKAVLPTMREQKSGLIINVTSVQARLHIPIFTTYNATKVALDALTVGYHYELRSFGIDVVALQPGAYNTTDIVTKAIQPANPAIEKEYGEDMLKVKEWLTQLFTPGENSQNPQEVANKLLDLVNAPKGSNPLWTPIGTPLASYLDKINQDTQVLAETVLTSIGAL